MENNSVSVIMPVFNSQAHVSEAIRSVLDQSYEDLELIIVDDASTDGSSELIGKFTDDRIKVITLEVNSGAGNARNEGIRYARGRYIAFLDADDIWTNDKLSRQIEFMKAQGIGFSYSDYFLMDQESRFTHRVICPEQVDYKKMLKNNYIGCLTAVYDTELLGKRYMPDRRKRQDWALWLSILRDAGQARGLQEPLAGYRKTKNSLSRNKLKLMGENYSFYREFSGYGPLASTFLFIRFLFAYSRYKITAIKSID